MKLTGIGVSPGVAHGRIVEIHHDEVVLPVTESPESHPQLAVRRIAEILEDVATGMERRATQLHEADAKEVLVATAMIARDPAILDEVTRQLSLGMGKFRALAAAVDHFATLLASHGGYMAERVSDLRDVHRRAHALLLGHPEPGIPELDEPAILIAADLSPADTAGLDPKLVLALVTELGGPTSHTSILAAQLEIPTVVRCEGVLAAGATTAVVDGATGEVSLNPEDAEHRAWRHREARRTRLSERSQGPGHTKDGKHIELLANISTALDAEAADAANVEGAGLVRSEFLYLDRYEEPSCKEQTETYRRIFKALSGRKVVVRTLDAGADKPLAFATMGPEANPALGQRGLRLYEAMPSLVETQLKAIATAARDSDATVWVMAPMISTPLEATWFANLGHDLGLERVGTMVEVPAAALRARHVLAGCDFASVGTNDLSQYLFAADRHDGRLVELLDAWQPALWELTQNTAIAGESMGKPVGMCGEACGDPLLALLAVGAGITSLSMALTKVPMVRASLALHSLDECKAMLDATLEARCPAEAREAVRHLAHPAVRALV